MKKITAVILALALILSLSVSALAVENTTISVAEGDTRTYAVYQIFTGDLDGDTLSNVKWGVNGTGTAGEAVPQETLDLLASLSNATDKDKLAQIEALVNMGEGTEPFGTVSADAPLTAPTGYYIIVDKGAVAEGEAYSLNLVQVVGPTTITPKVGEVTSEKKVDDENDSVADDPETEAVEGEDATDWQDSADYDIGDEVPFKLTGTVPTDYNNYTTYYYCFHDVQSAGLTFNPETVKVYVDGTEITEGFEVVTECEDNCTFEIKFADLKAIAAVQAGSVITVEYTSTLNDAAVLGAAGNPNTMDLEYSNNPNGEGTGRTPEDKVIVFTYKVVVNKIDGESKEALAGAGFTLYKKNAAGKWVAVGEELTGNELTTFVWNGLDDGQYKLSETTTPAGYNTMADIEFTISAEHDVESADPKLTVLDGGVLGTGEVSTGAITKDIENNKGTVLPETGALGTVMFITIGAALAMAAAVFMITRKKMSVYED